jgi:hypothetical protein
MIQDENINNVRKLHSILDQITKKYDINFYNSFYFRIYETYNDILRLTIVNYNESKIIIDIYLFIDKKIIKRKHTTGITLIGIEVYNKEQNKQIDSNYNMKKYEELSRLKLAFNSHTYTAIKGENMEYYHNDVLHSVHDLLTDAKIELEDKHLYQMM